MARKNDKAKPKPKRTDRRKPKDTAAPTPVEDEAIVSRTTMIRHTGRGGRGR